MEYNIREANCDDFESIIDIFNETVKNVNSTHYTETQIIAWLAKATRTRWEELFSSELKFILAENDLYEIVGFSSYNQNGYIHSMFVSQNNLRKGVATALLSEIVSDLSVAKLTAEVSITAKPFFEKNGFTVTSLQTVYINEIGLDNYLMNKLL